MFLNDLMKNQGSILFRWRSYLPLVLIPAVIFGATESGYFEREFGELFEEIWDVFAVAVSFFGLAVRAAVVGYTPRGTSGRNTRKQRADVLNTTGMYSLMRNPLYFGNFLILLGFALAVKVWWVVLLAVGAFALYYERIIIAEETFLHGKFGEVYSAWMNRTPAFFPNPWLWRRPDLPFSLRNVLRREYQGFFLIIVVHTIIEITTDLLGEHKSFQKFVQEDFAWFYFLGFGAAVYLTLRILHKYTRVLHVAGR